ncbi:MAG: DUF2959 domain-containing protein [Deltaproteobacteria bacterium]|nr:MAG: DUF2959 domain-containing protein [Deltaproteobacteria bacterium]RLC09116.1 MAG: DUF2959 domain-containing protein [Deltaproteobacteria bacterium]
MITTREPERFISYFVIITISFLLITGCSKTYYSAMEKVGIHKRDILVDRVENARDAQADAQEQFKDALEQFGSVITVENTDLKDAYEKLNAEYKESNEAAKEVSRRIEKVESVADDLFAEWENELGLYKNKALQDASARNLIDTQKRYDEMLASMHRVEKSMDPVLRTFRDNVLFLKHNLNAQAIGSLRSEFSGLKVKIEVLVKNMNDAITNSNQFIEDLNQ